ncbi:universal stress protein [soil metagenome]
MKSILVPVSGSDTDRFVLDAAFELANRLKAHLAFAHVPLLGLDIGISDPHVEYARGEALGIALKERALKSRNRETRAREAALAFCAAKSIAMSDVPGRCAAVTANWIANACDDPEALLRLARTYDLIIAGRSDHTVSLNLLDLLVADCGRPILILPARVTSFSCSSVAIWWKDHGAGARAVSASMPIIRLADRVSVLTAAEPSQRYADTVEKLAMQMRWHGIDARSREIEDKGETAIEALWSASREEGAGLVVMGAYSRSRVREGIFGGCTQSVLEEARLPVLLLH